MIFDFKNMNPNMTTYILLLKVLSRLNEIFLMLKNCLGKSCCKLQMSASVIYLIMASTHEEEILYRKIGEFPKRQCTFITSIKILLNHDPPYHNVTISCPN